MMSKTSRDLTGVRFFLFLIFMLIPLTSFAAVPQTINYQGYLTNASGTPVTGTADIVFSIYDVSSGGSSLWTETQSGVPVDKGVYSVILGSATPITLSFDAQYYLGVKVDSDDEMTPRQQLTSAAYSFRARTADSVEGASCNDGDICTENDKYENSQCTGTPKNCDDGLNFTTDSCNPGTGQCSHTTVLCQGQNCDDGNSCTNDSCDVSGCVHTPNSYSTTCYTGPGGTFGIGNCSSGTKTCSGGFFGACVGQTLPASETCGGGDENCDGFLNEENAVGCTYYRKDVDGDGYGINDTKCLCAPGKKHDSDSTTYKYYTAPNTGTYDCNDSNHHINPGAAEVCNNVIDDNCNGQTDESCTINADTVDGKNASDLKIILAASSSSSVATINTECTNYQGGEVTINVTGAGTIVVDANAWVQIDHTNGTKDIAYIAIGTTTTDCGVNENKGVINMPLAYSTTTLDNSVHVSKSLHVTSSGNYTFYLNGLMSSGQNSGDQFYFSNMRAVFYPD